MPFRLYDFVSTDGKNEFKNWMEDLQTRQRAKLNEKLDKLAMHGEELFPELLTASSVPGILKLRVRGNVQLRPLLCRGPLPNEIGEVYTLLMGAKEIGDKWHPPKAPEKANEKKKEVESFPNDRRRKHERVR